MDLLDRVRQEAGNTAQALGLGPRKSGRGEAAPVLLVGMPASVAAGLAFTVWQQLRRTADPDWREMMASSVPAPDDDPYADRRVYPRVAVALPASLQVGDERHSVRLLDVSPGGAKVDCAARLAIGAAVTLDCGTLGRAAVVRWQNGGLLGLCFDNELDAREVRALIARSDALSARMEGFR